MDIVYHPDNRSQVVQFLTRQFGFESAVDMMNTRTIPESLMEVITQKVIPRPLKPVSLNWHDESVKKDFMRYTARTYPHKTIQIHELSDYDMRMIHTMNRLRSSYDTYRNDRRRTMLSNIRDIAPPVSQVPKKVKDTSAIVKSREPVMTCRAIKMNGEKCTAKTKNGTEFCCRHSKK